jgi:hypothetical protein
MKALEKYYPEENAPKPYVHLAMAHGAGLAYSTIIGKANFFKGEQGITNFAAVPDILRRHVRDKDFVRKSSFPEKK